MYIFGRSRRCRRSRRRRHRQTKLNLSVSVPLAGQSQSQCQLDWDRTSQSGGSQSGVPVPQLEEHMFRQIHLPCHNAQRYAEILPKGVVSQLHRRETARVIDMDMDMGCEQGICLGEGWLNVVLPACSLHVTRLNEKWNLLCKYFSGKQFSRDGAGDEL